MFHRTLDANHDWNFGQSLADFAYGEQAIELNIQTRVLEWVGDCFFNQTAGVDWINLLDVGQQANLDQAVRAIIIQSYGVVQLQALAINFYGLTRVQDMTYSVQTIYSPSFQGQINLAAGVGL